MSPSRYEIPREAEYVICPECGLNIGSKSDFRMFGAFNPDITCPKCGTPVRLSYSDAGEEDEEDGEATGYLL